MSKVMTMEMLATMSSNKPEKTLSLAQEHANILGKIVQTGVNLSGPSSEKRCLK